MSAGISPDILFPTTSKILRKAKLVIHLGIWPEIPFQSARVKLDSLWSLQMKGEMEPVI